MFTELLDYLTTQLKRIKTLKFSYVGEKFEKIVTQ